MNRLQKMELMDLVAKEIAKLETYPIIDIFFNTPYINIPSHIGRNPDLTVYATNMLKGIEDDKLIMIAQNEFNMDITRFTNIVSPKFNEMNVLKKIELIKKMVPEIIKQIKNSYDIYNFMSYTGIDGKNVGNNRTPLDEYLTIRLSRAVPHKLLSIAQNELGMDITQFTDREITKNSTMKIVTIMELGNRLGVEIAKRLNSRDKIDAFFGELNIPLSAGYSENTPLDAYASGSLKGKNKELYIRIAQEELDMDISDLLT